MSSSTSQRNRRVMQRRKPRTAIKIECRRGLLGLGPNLAESLLDVAEGGIRLILKEVVELQKEMEIVLQGYGVRPVKRVATVRWVVPLADGRCAVGFQFQSRISYGDIQQLARP